MFNYLVLNFSPKLEFDMTNGLEIAFGKVACNLELRAKVIKE